MRDAESLLAFSCLINACHPSRLKTSRSRETKGASLVGADAAGTGAGSGRSNLLEGANPGLAAGPAPSAMGGRICVGTPSDVGAITGAATNAGLLAA